MAKTTVGREQLDTSNSGQAVVAKLVQGTGITLSSTGADAGTGDVTISVSSSGSSSSVTKSINQTAHGLSVGNVIGISGASTYAKAQANTAANAAVVGIVSTVTDANNFIVTTSGYVTGLSALTANTLYFLDPASAGGLTSIAPTTAGQISKPVFYSDTTTSGYFINQRGLSATASSQYIIYASNTCALNSNLLTGGGTDDTTALQALLDSVTALGEIRVIVERPALISNTLRIRGNTTLEFLPGAGVFMAASSNTDIMTNYNRSATTLTDKHIRIFGGFFNGNVANQTGTFAHTVQGFSVSIIGLWFSGVEDIILRDVHVYDSVRFAYYFNNCSRVLVENWRAEWSASQTSSIGNLHDGVHLNGPITDIVIRNGWHNGGDDAVGMNSDELRNDGVSAQGAGTYYPTFMGYGSITNALVDGLSLNGSFQGVRLLNMVDRCENINIRDIKGSVYNYAVGINYTYSGGANDGYGNIGNVLIEDINIQPLIGTHSGSSYLGDNYPEWCVVGVSARFDHMTIRNVGVVSTPDLRPICYFAVGTANSRSLVIDGVTLHDAGSGVGPIVKSAVNIPNLMVANFYSSGVGIDASGLNLVGTNLLVNGIYSTTAAWTNPNVGNAAATFPVPLAQYNLNDTTDSGINGYNLTNHSSVTFTSGKIGNAANFNGTSQYLTNSSIPVLASGDTLTITGWFKPTSLTTAFIFSKAGNATGNITCYAFTTTAGEFKFAVHTLTPTDTDTIVSSGTSTIAAGTYYFFALQVNDTTKTVRLKLNNGSWVSSTYPGTICTTTLPLAIAAGYNNDNTGVTADTFFTGQIDALRFYKSYLTDAQISSIYNSGSGTEADLSQGSNTVQILDALTTTSSNYSVLLSDRYILVDTTSNAITITLPTAAGIRGRPFVIKDWKGTSSNYNITVATTSSQTIDGAPNSTISSAYGALTVTSDGTNWIIIDSVNKTLDDISFYDALYLT